MTPSPPLLDTAEARGAVEVWAMPARRIGCFMERRVVRGVVRLGEGEDIVGSVCWCRLWVGVAPGRLYMSRKGRGWENEMLFVASQ